ncbi:MAG: AhpC/TSA family protein [Bacteroidaceae bacterium]|nr:AhpC/TSA family protein [Bacteroidaceae bacterium]
MKRAIIASLLGLVTMAGQAQIKCHIEGTLATDKLGDEIVIYEEGLDMRHYDDPRYHVKAKDGRFTYDIETDCPRLYHVQFLKSLWEGGYMGQFLTENGTVKVTLYADQAPKVISDGAEGRMYQVLDSIEDDRFWNQIHEIDEKIENPVRLKEFYNADFLSTLAEVERMNKEEMPQAYIDSLRKVWTQYENNPRSQYTEAGWILQQRRDSLSNAVAPFRVAYYAEHPMLWALYDTKEALRSLNLGFAFRNFDPSKYEPYLKLYHEKLSTLYPGHPVHQQIATAEAAYRLQPGKPYMDYTVRDVDGQLVPISSLIKGKVALIDLWASWCGSCRRHSKAMIPVYERYKDKGFTVIAIARETNRENMEKAMQVDGYPWPSLLELNDENKVWLKNGANNAGGRMFLIDRDGTILSTSTDAEELEPLIKKALNGE